jgi:formylglycine-generating enzyme required for sulfatase activity
MITKRDYALLLLLVALLAGCTLPRGFESEPAAGLGDTNIRSSDHMRMVYVPAGEFVMGSDMDDLKASTRLCLDYSESGFAVCRIETIMDEYPKHVVELSGFWIDRTEVTNAQFRLCVEAGACQPPVDLGSYTRDEYFNDSAHDDYPVIWVTKSHAVDYCAWSGARLPSEAEWEYAARGPESTKFPWGDAFEKTHLNYCDASCPSGVGDPTFDDGHPETAPVGSFPDGVSWCGALDMAGNVREWVSDWKGYYNADRQVDPQGPAEGDQYVTRGGCWLDTPDDILSACRGANSLDYSRHKVGIRCAMDAE